MQAVTQNRRYVPSDNTLWIGGELPVGFALQPFGVTGLEVGKRATYQPHEIAPIPNPEGFSGKAGPDIIGSAHIVKTPSNGNVFVPTAFQPFLPTLQLALNIEQAIKGEDAVRKSWVTLRPSRHTSDNGFAHQPEFAGMHDHRYNGTSSYYVAADRSGTVFPTFTVRDGVVARFEEGDRHLSPVVDGRRTFAVIVFFHEQMPDRRNSTGLHRFPHDGGTPQKAPEWLEAGNAVLDRDYSKTRQEQDIRTWLAVDFVARQPTVSVNGDKVFHYARVTPLNHAYAATLESKGREFGVKVEPIFADRKSGAVHHPDFVKISGRADAGEAIAALVHQHRHFLETPDKGKTHILAATPQDLFALTEAPNIARLLQNLRGNDARAPS